MSKLIEKLTRQAKHKVSPLDESESEDLGSGEQVVALEGLSEASEILVSLANSMPAHMGTSHGLGLIESAKKWVAAYVEPKA